MAEVENDQQWQLWRKNLTRLVDVFNFVALTSMITTLLLAFINDYIGVLIIIIIAALNFLIGLLSIFSYGWIFSAQFMFMMFVQVLPYNTHSLAVILIIGCISLVIGLVGFSFLGFLFFWRKRFPGSNEFGFTPAEMQVEIKEAGFLLFLNGFVSLFGWLILQDIELRVVGFVLVGFLGVSSPICCVFGLVYRWKKYHRAGAMVSSAEMQLEIMEDSIILFVNGCASLFGWLFLQDIELRVLGFVLVGFLGVLSSVCCVCRLVYRWKEYHRAGAMVSSVASTTSTAAV